MPNDNINIATALQDDWHKVAAILMHKAKSDHEVITKEDIDDMPSDSTIVLQELSDGIHIRLVDLATAQEMARRYREGSR